MKCKDLVEEYGLDSRCCETCHNWNEHFLQMDRLKDGTLVQICCKIYNSLMNLDLLEDYD